FFFFQAEDGIRDFHVTGVQTCALPILFSLLSRDLRCVTAPSLTAAWWAPFGIAQARTVRLGAASRGDVGFLPGYRTRLAAAALGVADRSRRPRLRRGCRAHGLSRAPEYRLVRRVCFF